jgi:DNA mismatch repair protein MutL
MLETLLDEYKQTQQKVGSSAVKAVASSLAKAATAGEQKSLLHNEMQQIVDELFACENPNYSTEGKKIMTIIDHDELEKYLR